MKAQIIIRKNIKARSTQAALKIVREEYPYARIIAHKMDVDFRFVEDKDYNNRTMTVAFIDDYEAVWED